MWAANDKRTTATNPLCHRISERQQVDYSRGMSHIELRGVRVHNLKEIDLRLPLGKLIAITGVSGAGKSSLAFDTLVAEGRRRYIETFAPSARQFLERIERPDTEAIEHLPAAVAFRADEAFPPRATLGTLTEIDDLLRMLLARLGQTYCPQCDAQLLARTPDEVCRDLKFLSDGTRFVVAFPAGVTSRESWPQLGFVRAIAVSKSADTAIISATTVELAQASADGDSSKSRWVVVDRLIAGKTDAARLLESVEQAFQHGREQCVVLSEPSPDSVLTGRAIEWDGRRWQLERFSRRRMCFDCDIEFPPLEPDLFNADSPIGACAQCSGSGTIDVQRLTKVCPECDGSRLNSFARCVRVADKSIVALRLMPISVLKNFVRQWDNELAADDRVLVANVLAELTSRLQTLAELGLDYLALGRSPRSLSRGERQRARLAALLASRLDNALYVLDEPSAGLHSTEQWHVLQAIQRLQQAGNTVIVVEHNHSFIEAADEVIDLGSGAGREGGRIVFQGSVDELRRCRESATAEFLRRNDKHDGALDLQEQTQSGPQLPLNDDTDTPPSLPRWSQASAQRDSSPNRFDAVVQKPGDHRDKLGGVACLPSGLLKLDGARLHNLRGLDVEFPLGVLCAVTGVSGAGKSSLVEQTLFPALCRQLGVPCLTDPVGEFSTLTGADQIDSVVFIDSAPIRRSSRANAATMLQVYSEMRRLFAETIEAKVKNFSARHFSFNATDGGRCPRCRGLGAIEIDMQFLANLSVTCPECHGTRFQREVLDAKLRGLSIAEVLNLSATEAFTFFRGQPKLQRRLKSLKDVGLGYLPLGQPASTLSRGESQRLKLATLLSSSSRSRTLFLMDEPTAGLHPADVAVLVQCFQRLIEVGHSLIVIEHRAELVRAADWVIELGPGAGDAGGQVVFAGANRGQAPARFGASALAHASG